MDLYLTLAGYQDLFWLVGMSLAVLAVGLMPLGRWHASLFCSMTALSLYAAAITVDLLK